MAPGHAAEGFLMAWAREGDKTGSEAMMMMMIMMSMSVVL